MKTTILLWSCLLALCWSCNGKSTQTSDGTQTSDNSEESSGIKFKAYVKFAPDDVFVRFIAVLDSEGNFIAYDDETDYDDVAPWLYLVYQSARALVKNSENPLQPESFEHYLEYCDKLPIKDQISDPEIKEILNKVYYDYLDAASSLVLTDRRYGQKEYSKNLQSTDLRLFRFNKNDYNKYESDDSLYPKALPPDGTLCLSYF